MELDDRRRLESGRAGRRGADRQRRRENSACGSAAARRPSACSRKQWHGHVDEVIVVDDHITGVLTEHQAGRFLGMTPAGIRDARTQIDAGPLFPGGESRHRLGRHRHPGPAGHHRGIRSQAVALAGPALADGVDDRRARRVVRTGSRRCGRSQRAMPDAVRGVVERIGENCEPALCTVLFVGGAGGSLRAGVTENPVLLTRSIKQSAGERDLRRRAGLYLAGRRHHGDGRCRAHAGESFGTVPTPAIVAPIEFTMRRRRTRLGGHLDAVRPLESVLASTAPGSAEVGPGNPWPLRCAEPASAAPVGPRARGSMTAAGICSTARSI